MALMVPVIKNTKTINIEKKPYDGQPINQPNGKGTNILLEVASGEK